ncbi:putative cytochrome P450 [Tothia fuscella]|uniref:Cytochrome P450 n=1 Tax=Tothia fuscella TaxID=1048955 RepID=A0A9P4TU32_9PEZI|nr:putative cytochrome P450 [Tothia fuscella]
MAAVDVQLPQLWDINKSEAVMANDPQKIYKEYDYLRSHCPVAHVDVHLAESGGHGFWMLTKYEDIKRAAGDSDTFISSKCALVPSDPRGIRRPPLKFDGEQHTPYRTAIDRTVKPSRIKRLEKILDAHANDLFDGLLAKGQGDICNEFGAEFSGLIEKEWLNLSEEASRMLTDNVRPFVQSWRTGDWEAVKRASDAFYVIARDVIADRRVNPRDPEEDPASSLLLERDAQGELLDEFNLVGAVRQALIVAMVAPSILQGAMTVHLAKDKALQNKLRSDPSLVPSAIEEFIRMYTPYRGFARTATCPVTFQGSEIPADEPITMTYAAANRDPDVFPEPDKFILDRENITQHLGFGRGKHRCAGMPLARMALKVFLTTLLRRTKDFDIAGALGFARLPEIGLLSCPVKFHVS